MEITDVRIKLAEKRLSKLQGFATITVDGCFVIRDLKVIQGTSGLFVAMPSRKLTARCPRCHCKNHLRAQYCNECGAKMRPPKMKVDDRGRARLHADIAHPIKQECRDMIQSKVLAAYQAELERAKQEGYKPPADEFVDAGPEGPDDEDEPLPAPSEAAAGEVRESSLANAEGSAAESNAPRRMPENRPAPRDQRWRQGREPDRDMRV